MSAERAASAERALSFERFWSWMQKHPNCILRAGTGDAVLFDHEDHHWFFGVDPEGGVLYVQSIRGKRAVAEISIQPSEIAFVQTYAGEQDEWFFDLFDDQQRVLHYFVLTHSYDEEPLHDRGTLN